MYACCSPAAPQELSRRLLAEQNAEYEASLAADREREAQRQEEQRKAEAEARQREEEEARARYGYYWFQLAYSCLGLPAVLATLSGLGGPGGWQDQSSVACVVWLWNQRQVASITLALEAVNNNKLQ